MSGQIIGEKIYEYEVAITGAVDFGVSLEALTAGQAPIPPQGARFDFSFEGTSTGRLTGTLRGIDYFHMRADGRGELNIRGVIETHDGARIALLADGVSSPRPDGTTDLFENVRLSTAAEAYGWVNARQIWAVGTLKDGVIKVAAYMP